MGNVLKWLVIAGGCGWLLAGQSAVANPGLEEHSRSADARTYNREVDTVLREIKGKVRDARYNIKVTDRGDNMLLEGDVDSERAREQIVAVASSATAKRIANELRVRPGPSDSQIAEHVRGALRKDYPQLADRIQVEVRNGVAYLSGNLRNHREVDELLSTALMVEGVTDIRSDITLGGRPYATQRLKSGKY
jgi:osmotically-inducible protein OsmY